MLRKRILSQILAIQLVVVSLLVGAYIVVYDSYVDLEQKTLLTNVRRAKSALEREIDNLGKYTNEWGKGGLLYYSMRNENPASFWMRGALVESIVDSFDIDKVAIYNVHQELLIAKERDLDSMIYQDISLDNDFFKVLNLYPELITHRSLKEPKQGLLIIGDQIYMLSTRAISSGLTEEVHGTLISGVSFSRRSITRLGRLVVQDLNILTVDEFARDAGNRKIIDGLNANSESVEFVPIDDDNMMSYALITDIRGASNLLLTIKTPRDIILKAKDTILTTGVVLLASFTFLTLYVLLFLDFAVLRRVKDLSRDVTTVKDTNFRDRLTVTGNDELSWLTRAFNGLLASLQNTQETLREERDKANTTLASIGDAVITTNLSGKIQYLNHAAIDLTNAHHKDYIDKPLETVFQPTNELGEIPDKNLVQKILETKTNVGDSEYCFLTSKNNVEMVIESLACPIRDQQGEITGAVIIFRDVSHTRTLQKNLIYQASHDALTELYNRAEFERQLNIIVDSAKGNDIQHHLLFIDLDHFKLVNDSCGHIAGDKVLCEIAQIMRSMVRKTDIIARIGGDEFGVILTACKFSVAYRIGEQIREKISEFRYVQDDKCFTFGASIGLVSLSDNLGQDEAGVLSMADKACMAAKTGGRNRIHVYQLTDDVLKEHELQTQWVSKVADALEHNRFTLYYQKITPTHDGLSETAEILIRMVNADGGLIGPGAFLPAAERYGLMRFIDKWVIENFCHWAEKNPQIFDQIAVFSINLSGQSLGDTEFLNFVIDYFSNSVIEPEKICFEITETAAIQNISNARYFITTLKSQGFSFSLDDFGSGMSSFSYLKNLPVDSLKIDGAFIKNIENQTMDYNMVRSINEIGHIMGIKTVAEFVENENIHRLVQELGIDYAQGFHIHEPEALLGLCAGNDELLKRTAD